MIEDDLRAAFGRHEPLTPPTGPLRAAIDRLAARRRQRRRRWQAGGVALAVLGVLGVGVPLFTPERAGTPPTADLIGASDRPLATGAVTVLLLGIDSRASVPPLADSVLLLHLPADRSRPYLISLPRDLRVPIPGHDTDKLNAAFAFGAGYASTDPAKGYELTRQTVANLTGVRIDTGVVLTYSALRSLTNEVGGVPVCLPEQVRSAHTRRVFPAACQRLDGTAAVDLLRQRYGLPEGSQDRDRNARIFATALVRSASDQGLLTNPVRLAKLLSTVGPDLAVSPGDATMLDLTRLIPTLRSLEPVGLSLPANESTGPSHYLEADPKLAPELLTALREDRLGDWVGRHPKLVDGAR
ncbi:LCP family protein [Micromonospora sp. NPDC005203]|uniref:LCP family protein n=1 Tax=Micromonospora sp. NPDC005203 TaxID=3364226 RepID=UPI0036BA7CB6